MEDNVCLNFKFLNKHDIFFNIVVFSNNFPGNTISVVIVSDFVAFLNNPFIVLSVDKLSKILYGKIVSPSFPICFVHPLNEPSVKFPPSQSSSYPNISKDGNS
jgi:hypothetical protein